MSASTAPQARSPSLHLSIDSRVSTAHAAFQSGRTKPLSWRKAQLEALVKMLTENAPRVHSAMASDLGKSDIEAHLTEVQAVVEEARHTLKNLRRWTADRRVAAPMALGRTRAWIQREPLGTVLIIGPWNYPFHLLLIPLIGVIAAGNAAVLKPSELAPACSTLVAELIGRYLDQEAFQVVQGGVEETTRLLECRFDHIFYTGNGPVGQIVMAAASRHLTPVTLELGGKSPVWVDETANLDKVAKALVWGKFSNCGQTCVAPDYVLTTPALAKPLAQAIATTLRAVYGADPKSSPDYGRIVSTRHAARLATMLGAGKTVVGGLADIPDRYVAPTVLVDVPMDAPVMREEIFGPILPIVTVKNLDAAIDVINAGSKPLALYAFTERKQARDALLARTSSGGVAFNAVMLQLGVPALPFGGVGGSGMGRYHGEHSVATFSHERSVLRRLAGLDPTVLARPPFKPFMRKALLGQGKS